MATNALAERPPERELGAIVLIAAPFVGAGGWHADGFELPHDLGARLPPGGDHQLDDDLSKVARVIEGVSREVGDA
ncbi:hypothetical protein ABZU25_23165 [Micromonospora sp. NPDC005215]|uniref:hypothetical protein n=1 Tax=Micromonospora sp. NPDC005215 TaxID=3157024 RepID=UPI0033AB812A